MYCRLFASAAEKLHLASVLVRYVLAFLHAVDIFNESAGMLKYLVAVFVCYVIIKLIIGNIIL